jgi:predicted outer membrane repeat protein
MRSFTFRSIIAGLVLLASLVGESLGERATPAEMEQACRNWMLYVVRETGDWGGEANPSIRGSQDIVEDGTFLGRCFSIAPSGYVVVPALRELPPIKAYSEQYDLDFSQRVGYPQLLREVLQHRTMLYRETYGSLDVSQPETGDVLFGRVNGQQWDLYINPGSEFLSVLDSGVLGDRVTVGPLLTTRWHQGAPYNMLAPMGDGGQCVAGCVATAASQVMNYYEWPPAGVGDHSYWWNGDTSCGGNTPGEELYADFSDPYDWDNMRNSCSGGCSEDEEAAMAELCYEVAVAFEMDFGHCGSGAYTGWATFILPDDFLYQDTVDLEARSSHSAQSWYDMIKSEVNNGRPMLYTFQMSQAGHAVVCDGWSDDAGMNQIHLNYGWGGDHDGFYTVDNLFGSIDPMQERVYRHIMPPAQTYVVKPDGTGDFPTIQAALTASFGGCTIELADGTFTGDGNRDIYLNGKHVTIRSQSGNPEGCIIDCQGDPENPHTGFVFEWGEGPEAVIEGITIANAYSINGGGLRCDGGASPTINNCVFSNCSAAFGGGMIVRDGASPTLNDCVFNGNSAGTLGGAMRFKDASGTLNNCVFLENSSGGGGGAIECRNSSPAFYNCTFYGNEAEGNGGGLLLRTGASPLLENTILAFCERGVALFLVDDTCSPTLACCDIYGNNDGDGDAGPWIGMNNNIAEDPLFCDAGIGNLGLCSDSPCLPEDSPCGELIGAYGEECGPCGSGSSVEDGQVTQTLFLSPSQPNPFASSARITFAIPNSREGESVSLNVYDGAGRVVRVLVDRTLPAGFHTALWDGNDEEGRRVSSGVYFYLLRWNGDSRAGRMLLLR